MTREDGSGSPDKSDEPSRKQTAQAERRRRLEASLKANIARRKAQAGGRRATAETPKKPDL